MLTLLSLIKENSMARSIILRFDATCHDCGKSIAAGKKARWFGRGRVSCCGVSKTERDAEPFRAPETIREERKTVTPPGPLPASASPEVRKFIADTEDDLSRPATGRELTAEELGSGIPEHWIPKLAESDPNMLLLVRLRSGARFLVPARDAQHVIRCVAESLMDGIRDVTRSPNQ